MSAIAAPTSSQAVRSSDRNSTAANPAPAAARAAVSVPIDRNVSGSTGPPPWLDRDP